MNIVPPRPALMPESLKHLSAILEAEAQYAQATGRSAREDTELLGILRDIEDELTMTPTEALVVLTQRGFHLYGDSKREEYYYDATRDYVSSAAEDAGLTRNEED